MDTTKPRFLALLAVVVAGALVSAACSDADDDTDPPAATTAAAPTSVADEDDPVDTPASTTTSSATTTSTTVPSLPPPPSATEAPAHEETDAADDTTAEDAPAADDKPEPDDTTPEDAPAADVEPAPVASAFDGVGDSFYPFLGNGGYDVLHYDITLDVEPAERAIEAVTTITARSTEPLVTYSLDLHELDVAAVTVDGVDAAFSRYGHELAVELPDPLPAGAEFTTVVRYSGSPGAIDDPGVPFLALGWHWSDTASFTASEPLGSMTWFPSNNHPSDKATFEIRITVPEGLTAASNGVLTDETTEEGRTTATWVMDDPMATYLASVYIGEFERLDHGPADPDGPLLRDYVPVGAEPEVAEALSITPDVIDYFEDLFGPYPFDAYGTIVMPFEIGFALENQTLSLHGIDTLGPSFVIHEIMHQWLGNSNTLDDWSETWMHEGFAIYLTFLYQAERGDRDLDDTMARVYDFVAAEEAAPLMALELGEMFGLSPYYRGALALYALHRHTGDDLFKDILRVHYERGAGATTSTAAFLSTVWEWAGSEAVEVLEPWLYDETMPASPAPPPEESSDT